MATTALSVLAQRAQTVLEQRYNLNRGKRVMVVHDQQKTSIGQAFRLAAESLGAEASVYELGVERFSDVALSDIQGMISTGSFDVFINLIKNLAAESEAKKILVMNQWTSFKETGTGTIIHSPGIDEAMLEIDINYEVMQQMATKLMEALQGAVSAKVTTNLGTDLEIDLTGRPLHEDVFPKQKGVDLSNFPCGEVYWAPREDGVNGILVADGTASSFETPTDHVEPLVFEIDNGQLSSMRWLSRRYSNQAKLSEIAKILLNKEDPMASIVGELGIGLAKYPTMRKIVVDEKTFKTMHLAFGNNQMAGGENTAGPHHDFGILKPNLWVYFAAGRELQVMEQGRLLI